MGSVDHRPPGRLELLRQKPPGPITFRRGMQQFYAIHRGRLVEVKPQ